MSSLEPSQISALKSVFRLILNDSPQIPWSSLSDDLKAIFNETSTETTIRDLPHDIIDIIARSVSIVNAVSLKGTSKTFSHIDLTKHTDFNKVIENLLTLAEKGQSLTSNDINFDADIKEEFLAFPFYNTVLNKLKNMTYWKAHNDIDVLKKAKLPSDIDDYLSKTNFDVKQFNAHIAMTWITAFLKKNQFGIVNTDGIHELTKEKNRIKQAGMYNFNYVPLLSYYYKDDNLKNIILFILKTISIYDIRKMDISLEILKESSIYNDTIRDAINDTITRLLRRESEGTPNNVFLKDLQDKFSQKGGFVKKTRIASNLSKAMISAVKGKTTKTPKSKNSEANNKTKEKSSETKGKSVKTARVK